VSPDKLASFSARISIHLLGSGVVLPLGEAPTCPVSSRAALYWHTNCHTLSELCASRTSHLWSWTQRINAIIQL
jgi:hypothetical protein